LYGDSNNLEEQERKQNIMRHHHFIARKDYDRTIMKKVSSFRTIQQGQNRLEEQIDNISIKNKKVMLVEDEVDIAMTIKIAVGKVVLRDKEQLVALRAYQRGLVMHQLKYLDEIRPMDEIGGLTSSQKIDPKELTLGKTLIENLTTEKFDPGQYSDTYAKELEKLIEAKSKGQKVTIKEEEEKAEGTTDILEALKASLKVKPKSTTASGAAKRK
jgi:DNA end-binding protein Ku